MKKTLITAITVIILIIICVMVVHAPGSDDSDSTLEVPEDTDTLIEQLNEKYDLSRAPKAPETEVITEYIEVPISLENMTYLELLDNIQKSIDTLRYKTEFEFDTEDIVILAQMVLGEAGGLSYTERAATIWVALNQYDVAQKKSPQKLSAIVTRYGNFTGWHPTNEVTADNIWLVLDVLQRYEREKNGETDVGRVIPSGYVQFRGGYKYRYEWKLVNGKCVYEKDANGNYVLNKHFLALAKEYNMESSYHNAHNWFFLNSEYSKDIYEKKYWDWSLPSPYKIEKDS